MTATSAIQGFILGVVEGSVAGVDFGLALGLGAPGRIPDGDPLGIGFEPALHSCSLLSRSLAFALAAGRAALCFSSPRNFFPRGPLSQSGGPARRFLDA